MHVRVTVYLGHGSLLLLRVQLSISTGAELSST